MTSRLTRAAIVAEARSWIGTRYRHQGSLKGVGCDCLGLVRGVWRNCIGAEPELPPTSARATFCCFAGARVSSPSTSPSQAAKTP